MTLDYENLERVPLGINMYGMGPVPDEEATDFVCMGCGQKWVCDKESHIKEMRRQYG